MPPQKKKKKNFLNSKENISRQIFSELTMNSQPDLKHYLSFFQINLASAISESQVTRHFSAEIYLSEYKLFLTIQ